MIWFLIAAGVLIVAVLLTAYICYRIAFYVPPRKAAESVEIEIPPGEVYEAFRESIIKWTKELRAMHCTEYSVQSFDGLTLYGKFYEYKPGAPIELMFHGYRGSAERDLSGGVQRAFQVGRSVLLIDQRCSGKSGGNTITFGVREHRDCLTWVDFAISHFGADVKLLLTGVSMGAATVLMAGGKELPPNVIGILADCGYTSAKEIISTVIRSMKLPPKLAYPFVKLGAKLYGHFDLDETSPLEMVKKCRLPVIFYHGEADDFVPCHMSKTLYEACSSRKELITIPGAGHGLSYPVAPEHYISTLRQFFGPEASAK